MANNSSEYLVREKYPNALAKFHDAVHELGQTAPVEPAHWAVYPNEGLGYEALGTGPSEVAAWAAASANVQGRL